MSLLTFAPKRASVLTWHSPGSVVAPGVAPVTGLTSGKPMPAAGETAHVRRLLVDRSRCGLGVSPAPPGNTEFSGTGEGHQWPRGCNPLSRRMWGRRPGRPGECHPVQSDPARSDPARSDTARWQLGRSDWAQS